MREEVRQRKEGWNEREETVEREKERERANAVVL